MKKFFRWLTFVFVSILLPVWGIFAGFKISKEEACQSPDNYMEWSSTGIVVTGLKRAYTEWYTHMIVGDSYDVLYYMVRQSDIYSQWWQFYDDYSFYQYDCQKKKITRMFWQLTFREILKYFPIKTYSHARVGFMGHYVEIRFYPDTCTGKLCPNDYYKVTLNYSPHWYEIVKAPQKWNPEDPQYTIIKEWTY